LKIYLLVILTFFCAISFSQGKEWEDALKNDSFIDYFSYAIDYPNGLNKLELYDSLYAKLGDNHYQVMYYYQPAIDTAKKTGYDLFLGTTNEMGDYHDNNIFEILVSKDDSIFFEYPNYTVDDLNEFIRKFLENPDNDYSLSDKRQEFINGIGEFACSKGMFFLIGDLAPLNPGRRTSWSAFLNTFFIIRNIIDGQRNELSQQYFNKSFNELNLDQKSSVIQAHGLGCLFFFTVPEWYKIRE
jgi:hypothetical protein